MYTYTRYIVVRKSKSNITNNNKKNGGFCLPWHPQSIFEPLSDTSAAKLWLQQCCSSIFAGVLPLPSSGSDSHSLLTLVCNSNVSRLALPLFNPCKACHSIGVYQPNPSRRTLFDMESVHALFLQTRWTCVRTPAHIYPTPKPSDPTSP